MAIILYLDAYVSGLIVVLFFGLDLTGLPLLPAGGAGGMVGAGGSVTGVGADVAGPAGCCTGLYALP